MSILFGIGLFSLIIYGISVLILFRDNNKEKGISLYYILTKKEELLEDLKFEKKVFWSGLIGSLIFLLFAIDFLVKTSIIYAILLYGIWFYFFNYKLLISSRKEIKKIKEQLVSL